MNRIVKGSGCAGKACAWGSWAKQYRQALELDPGSAAMKAEAQLVEAVRSNRKQGRQCLEGGHVRHALPPLSEVHSPSQLHIPLAPNIG